MTPDTSVTERVAHLWSGYDYETIYAAARRHMMRDVTGGFYDEHLARTAFEHGVRAAISSMPALEEPIDERHPILDAILSVRRKNAGDFSDTSKHSGVRGEAKDKAILDCYRAVETVLKKRAALTSTRKGLSTEQEGK